MAGEEQRDIRRKARWFWIPILLGVLGFGSMGLLITMEKLSHRQRARFALADALMDTQLHVANFHTLVEEYEEAVNAGGNPDTEPIWSTLDSAVRLVEAALWGGVNEQGLELAPLDSIEFREDAERIREILVSFRTMAVTGAGRGDIDLDKEERFDHVFNDVIQMAINLEKKVDAQNTAFLEYVEGAHKRIFVFWGAVLTLAVVGLIITEGLRVRAEEGLHEVNEILERQAAELEKHRSHLEELVSDRTTEVETLSERLIEAQEEERKRVSMELHDALGQALNAVKLQVRVIERELGPSQVEAKEYCDRLMSYLDDTIENVRRLSLNLSPTILEDLGLSSALQWLVKDFESADGMKVTALIDEIDSYLPKNKWITLYRIVQESLNNVERHAEASNVTVAVERDGDTVSVRIEDDGKGFDVGKPADSEEIGRPGMGLRTIQERISSMGGDMIFESAHNQGTRVAFRVPVANGVA